MQVTRLKRGVGSRSERADRVHPRSTGSDQRTWLLKGVIMAQIKRAGENPDR